MAYTKKTWECGETITADALNRMEDGIDEALQSGGGTVGYSCTETTTLLTEETVTTAETDGRTVGNLTYTFQEEPPEILLITFDGVEYNCNRQVEEEANVYGSTDPTFSDYPFSLWVGLSYTRLFTPSAGTYSIKLEEVNASVETSECFQKAVKSMSAPLVVNASSDPSLASTMRPSRLDASLNDIATAFLERGVAVVTPNGNIYPITKIEQTVGAVTIGEYRYVNVDGILKYPTGSPE